MATTKAEAGKALGAATNDIKTFAEKDEAARQAHRVELQKGIPCAPNGWVTAPDWLQTFHIGGVAWHDSDEHIKYLIQLKESRVTAEAYNQPNDYACPVALHLAYLQKCEESREHQNRLGELCGDRERKKLDTVMQGHHQQLCWDLCQLAKLLKRRGASVVIPTLGEVGHQQCLRLAHAKGLLALQQLNQGATDLAGKALEGALGATKKNIAQVIEEQGGDNLLVASLLAAARENFDRHGSVPSASYTEVGYQAQRAAVLQSEAAVTARRATPDAYASPDVPMPATRDNTKCVICMDAERCVRFMPCEHLACCQACAVATDRCCICRGRIESTDHVILS
jgi:hypothetical protein